MMPTSLRTLLLENPMNHEAMRVMRRFLRTGGDTGRALNYTGLGLLAVLYIWLLCAILRFQEDMSPMLLNFELGMLTIAVPMSIYAAVSGEREKLTWDSLILTRLTPAQIVVGKLVWRFALIALVMLLFVPPLVLSHWCGLCRGSGSGNQPEYTFGNLLRTEAMIGTWSILLAVFGLFLSARSRRSVTTLSIFSVSLLAFLVLVPLLVAFFGSAQSFNEVHWYESPLTALGSLLVHMNPFYATFYYNQANRQSYPDDMKPLMPYIPWIFAGLAAFWAKAAHSALRGLEAPRRNPSQGGR